MVMQLGFDPAPINFGFSAIDIKDDNEDWKLTNCMTLKYPIDSIGNKEDIQNFKGEVISIFNVYQPVRVSIERFMVRGMIGASRTEKVNLMIGIIISICDDRQIHTDLISAGAWKASIKPLIGPKGLNNLYNKTRAEVRRRIDLLNDDDDVNFSKEERAAIQGEVPHSIDGTIIALMHNTRYTAQSKSSITREKLKTTLKADISRRVARKLVKNAVSAKRRSKRRG